MSGKEENYTDERVRQILKGIMPQLEKYRFLHKVKPSADDSVSESETIFECLPAMWHYQAAELAKPVTEGCNEIFLHRSCSETDDLAQMPCPVVEELL